MPRIGVDGRVLVDRYHGIGRVTFELLSGLARGPGVHLVVFVDSAEPATRFDLDALRAQLNVEFVEFRAALPSLSQYVRWPLALRRHRLDVMVFPYQLGTTLIGGGRRRITIVHDCVFERDPDYAPSRAILVAYKLITRAVVHRSEIVTPSRATAADVSRHYGVEVPPDRIVEWGVSPQFAATEPAESAGLDIGEPYLLHVGARRPHKNVPFLVRVLAQLDESTHLVLVGSADERWADETDALATQLGLTDRIHQVSDVSESGLRALYRHAEAFVYPSTVEGFGLPLLEAMAAGTPVVASDIPVFRELGADAAEFARLGDPASWAAAIERLRDHDHRDALLRRGREVARDATWVRAADTLGRLLDVHAPATR